MADTDAKPDQIPGPGPTDFTGMPSDDEVDGEVKNMVEQVLNNQVEASAERQKMKRRLENGQNGLPDDVWTFSDTVNSLIWVSIGVGILGIISTFAAGAYTYLPLFVMGLLFLVYSHSVDLS